MSRFDLKNYYSTRFPAEAVCKMVTNNFTYPLEEVEFAFGEFFKRKKGFLTANDLRSYLESNEPNGIQFTGKHVPFVFEVDKNDYTEPDSKNRPPGVDPIDTSFFCDCGYKSCCDVCWEMVLRKPLMDCLTFLKDFMEYKKVFAMFSGKKGFWVFVLDDRAWKMDKEAKISLANRIPAFIDRQVTVQSKHLIKLPFSTHVTTKAICCPILNPVEFLPSHRLK